MSESTESPHIIAVNMSRVINRKKKDSSTHTKERDVTVDELSPSDWQLLMIDLRDELNFNSNYSKL